MKKLKKQISIVLIFVMLLSMAVPFNAYAEINSGGGIVSGQSHSIAIMSDGSVMSWGMNDYGQLGLGDMTKRTLPTTISGLTGVKQISAGVFTSLALMNDGTVKAWGYNGNGQLGLGDTNDRQTPTKISGLTGVKQVVSAGTHSFALMNDGTVKAWGYNTKGHLGLGDTVQRTSPTTIPGLTGVKQIYAKGSSYALMNDGTVKSWGYNSNGQLGLGDLTDRKTPTTISGLIGVVQLSPGSYYTTALMSDGTVKTWGANDVGQLGLGDTTQRNVPTTISGLSNVKDIATGELQSFVILTDNTVKAWGRNSSGQLGLGDTIDKTSPVSVPALAGAKYVSLGSFHSIAVMSDNTLKAFGNNGYGQLGIGNTINQLIPTTLNLVGVQLPVDESVQAVTAATAAVVIAETSKAQGDVDNARVLVNALADGSEKASLTARLDVVQADINERDLALSNAISAVLTAEMSKTQADVDTARALVNNLIDSVSKTNLTNRLDFVQSVIDAEGSNQQNLTLATDAVVKAEVSKLQTDVNSATTLVTALASSTEKEALQSRLAIVQSKIDYQNQVIDSISNMNNVGQKPAIEDMINNASPEDKSMLTDLLNDKIASLSGSPAETAVVKAEITDYQSYVDSAKSIVQSLTDVTLKSEYLLRLASVQSQIDANIAKISTFEDITGMKSWIKTNENDSNIMDLKITAAGNIVTVSRSSTISGKNFIRLFKMDGSLLWEKSFGGSSTDDFNAVSETSDGGFVAVGESSSIDGEMTGLNKGNSDGVVVKYDSTGNLVWKKSLGGSNNESVNGVISTTDGIYVAGNSNSSDKDFTGKNKGNEDGFIAKYDNNGTLIWLKNIGGTDLDNLNDIIKLSNGSLVAVGRSKSTDGDINSVGGTDVQIVVNLSSAGEINWVKDFDNDYTFNSGYSIVENSNHIFVVGSSENRGQITKLNLSGEIIKRNFIQSDWSSFTKIVNTPDGNMLAFGYMELNDYNSLMIKYSPDLEILNGNLFSGSGFESAYAGDVAANGDYIFAGQSTSKEFSQSNSTAIKSYLTKVSFTPADETVSIATAAVVAAETFKTQEKVDIAKVLVDALTDATAKSDLTSRLNAVQSIIDSINQSNQKLTLAKEAVSKAELSKLQEDVDAAKVLVISLTESSEKNSLLVRIDVVQRQINELNAYAKAEAYVIKVEETYLSSDLSIAKVYVGQLKSSVEKTGLISRLVSIESVIKLINDAKAKTSMAITLKKEPYITNAYTAVNKLPEIEIKQELLTKLDALKASLDSSKEADELAAKIKAATDAVVLAEKNQTTASVESAKVLIALLPTGATKTTLNDRVAIVEAGILAKTTAIENATTSVIAAESLKTQASVDSAKTLVTALHVCPEKTDLANRINAVQKQIDDTKILAENTAKLEAANLAVEKAEASYLVADVTSAKTSLNALLSSPEKTALNSRITVVENIINAYKSAESLVATAEFLKSEPHIATAYAAVNALVVRPEKQLMLDRLKAVEDAIIKQAEDAAALNVLNEAKKALEIAKVTTTEPNIYNAVSKIEILPPSSIKDTLLADIQALEALVAAKKLALINATSSVVTAETSKTQLDVDSAKTLVNALETSTEKTALLTRINAVQKIIDDAKAQSDLDAKIAIASDSVDKAELSLLKADFEAAKKLVVALSSSAGKTSLESRISVIDGTILKISNATTKVVTAETLKTDQVAIQNAYTAISEIPVDANHVELTKVKQDLTVRMATLVAANSTVSETVKKRIETLIKCVEIYRREPHMMNAYNEINKLPEGDIKTGYLIRLDALVLEITGSIIDNTVKLEADAIASVEKAELYKLASSVRLAKTRVEALTNQTLKTQLLDRLNAIVVI